MLYSGQENLLWGYYKEWCRILVGCSCSLQICGKGCRGYWELGDHISTSVSISSSTSSTILKASEEVLKEVRETDCQR